MAKRPYFRLGASLIVVGAAFIALNIWLLITFHWVLPGPSRGWGALGVIGLTMIVAGVMVLLGI
jgi:hypothetical protein